MPPSLLLRLHLRLPLHCDDDDFRDGRNVGSAWLGWHGWGGPVADPRDDDGTHQNTTNTTDTTAGRTEPPLRIPPRRLPAPTPLGPSTEHVPFHPSQRRGCRCPHCPDSPDRGEVSAAERGGGLWPVGIQPGRSACALWRRNGLAVNRECLQLVRCRQYPIPRGRLKHGSEAWGQGLLPRKGKKKRKKDMETKGRKRTINAHEPRLGSPGLCDEIMARFFARCCSCSCLC